MYLIILVLAAVVPAAAQLEPSGGATAQPLHPGHTVRIEWANDLQAPRVDLALWNGTTHTEETIATGLPAEISHHEWQIPATLPPGDQYRFVVRDHAHPRRALRSRSWVHITPAPPLVASVDDDTQTPQLTIHPSPATNDATLTWNASRATITTIEIHDTKQRRLASWTIRPGQTSLQIDLSDLPPGVHHVRMLSPTAVIATQMLPVVR